MMHRLETVNPQMTEVLLYQLLETEVGGISVYETALQCVTDERLREEWSKYLEETREHAQIARTLLQAFGLDPDLERPERKVVRMMGETLIRMMQRTLAAGDPISAQLTACECVIEAETKDHLNWHLIGEVAKHMKGEGGRLLRETQSMIVTEEAHHLFHSRGWGRELWMTALGLPAVLPPPEENKAVESALEAALAEESRGPSARLQH